MEVQRNPAPPKLSPAVIDLLSELCFRTDDKPLQPVDGIFVFSSSIEIDCIANIIEKLVADKISDQVFVTGGYPSPALIEDLGIDGKSREADLVIDALNQRVINNAKVFTEQKSNNTLDNVLYSLDTPAFKKCQSLLFVFKSHAAGRGFLTLRKFFPTQQILQKTFDTKYLRGDLPISKKDWHTHEFGLNRVWGEYLRIKKYGKRGDIAYEPAIELVKSIERSLGKHSADY
ncbi:MAG: DUF218 domain-containing protein [Gammaproteobacteria bacterium]|nr:DUF218 domain-containing protein [Gammaproteobacteria bacterium]